MSGIEHSSQPSHSKPVEPLRVAVLISGSGSNLQALIDAVEGRQLPGVEIVLVISNKASAQGLQRALKHKLPAAYIPWKKREEAEQQILSLLQLFRADLIVLAGWMRILSAEFTSQFPQRMINLHPALLPDDSGDTYTTSDGSVIPALRGLHVIERAIEAGLKVTGSTVHYVIPAVDAGPVIGRAEVAIEPGDTPDTLQEKLKSQEHRLIVEAVRAYAEQVHLVAPAQ
ncbi:phosphoribosylglycinamide formyltransferase [Dictyobacter aurantiacus]|uniref:Phosphoribosylglycinamide formyltransferase n=1 Tax=Dictyobacter aurantiacus TaxID=1936993 RepID=A0A401ZE51_9CHLR|nr:phosphoribosylglycinamide formyltransferase [Dictyobacter aurantiacus]GCE04968.1 phosphoribosylglycinamide formyltransferase [Dictyobacter aurantiacus]